MKYKVCILAAGIGSRMGDVFDHIHKAVLPVRFKAVISYIIEKFPEDIEIVIAVGHKKETIIDYLALAYPNRKFTYVEIDKYMGPGTGPGYSLLQCREHLKCPFVFSVADTILIEELPIPDHNWFGIAPVKETEIYCTVKIKNNLVYQLDDKTKNDNKFAFIGVAGIKDYQDFFIALEQNKELTKGEIQVSNGFRRLIEKKLVPLGVTWFDTGNLKNYFETNKAFSGKDDNFDFSKSNEFIYFVNNHVIKFFADQNIVQDRCNRARGVLRGLCPKIKSQKGNFYSYERIEGQTLYNVLDTRTMRGFLEWAKEKLWEPQELYGKDAQDFKNACFKFYSEKTFKRLEKFYAKTGLKDEPTVINGVTIPPLRDLLKEVDWQYIANGVPSNFHGDLQFDNILVVGDNPHDEPLDFVLLDWRHNFGGLRDIGDLYYDLAKLYGGILMSYRLMKKRHFSFDISGSKVYYNFDSDHNLMIAKEEYEQFMRENNIDLRKVKIMTALIYLNMSPLHNDPFDLLLYCLGRNMLFRVLRGNE